VFRGREGGSTDEGRGFFVPYEEISYVRLERVVKVSEIRRMFGETGVVDEEDVFGVNAVASDKLRAEPKSAGVDTQTPPPGASPLASQDPAAIAKQNLLDRIRAARANVAGDDRENWGRERLNGGGSLNEAKTAAAASTLAGCTKDERKEPNPPQPPFPDTGTRRGCLISGAIIGLTGGRGSCRA
jgi:hypothetical protein